jgi:hypothetical protein
MCKGAWILILLLLFIDAMAVTATAQYAQRGARQPGVPAQGQWQPGRAPDVTPMPLKPSDPRDEDDRDTKHQWGHPFPHLHIPHYAGERPAMEIPKAPPEQAFPSDLRSLQEAKATRPGRWFSRFRAAGEGGGVWNWLKGLGLGILAALGAVARALFGRERREKVQPGNFSATVQPGNFSATVQCHSFAALGKDGRGGVMFWN